MSRELESEIRNRLRDAPLPAAPMALHGRLASVVTDRRPSTARASKRSHTRLLLPVAAALVIAAVSIAGWGGGPRPSVEPSGSSGPIAGSAGPANAQLTVEARVGEWCHQIGGCEFHVTLTGPGGPWQGKLDHETLGSPTEITPRLPELLSPGSYVLSAEIHLFGDGIPEGATGPPDLGTIGTCSSEFVVRPETNRVQATLGFWLDRCSAGALVTPDRIPMAGFTVVPTISGDCGEFGCEYRVRLVSSGSSWQTVVRTPKLPDELVTGSGLPEALTPGSYVVEASSHRMSDEPFPGAGHRSEKGIAATCASEMPVDERTVVEATVRFFDETCLITISSRVVIVVPRATATPNVPEETARATPERRCGEQCWVFGPEYPDELPTGRGVPIERASLSDDGLTLTVEFWAGGCLSDWVPWVGGSGDEQVVAIFEVATDRTLPSGAACVMIALRYTYQLALPEPFTGSSVRDINGGALVLD